MWDAYYNVSTLEEALALLNQHQEKARIIAGGTDILIEMERGLRPDVSALIDITRVPGLDAITLEDGQIHLGALVNHNHVVGSDLIVSRALPLAQASWEVGAPQIRNRATIVGNLITASPANDTIAPLLAMNASVTLTSQQGSRTVALSDFYTGFRSHVMRSDEMMTDIQFPAFTEHQRGVFLKLGLRRAQAISVVNIAVVLTFDGDTVTEAAIAMGSVAATVIRLTAAEQALIGKTLTKETISEIANLASGIPKPIDDVRSTAEYRTEMVKVLVARALRALAAGTQSDTYPQHPAMLWGDHQARVNGNALSTQFYHDHDTVIDATVNGRSVQTMGGQEKSLLHWLREDAALPGTKEGCAEGECGACTVFLDDVAVMACMVPAPRAHQADIVTVEGLKTDTALHPIQDAFVDEGAVQCGYCTPGFLMSGAKLLTEHSQPTDAQIQQSISGNLCRCTGYYKIVNAFHEAAKQQSNQSNEE